MGRSGLYRSALNYFSPHGVLAPFCALASPTACLCAGYGTARSRPPFPLPSPRAPLRSLLPPAACRFAPAPRWSVLFDCGGPRRACGAGRPRRPLALARPAPRRAGKFFPPLPARLCAVGEFAACALPLASLGRRASACPPVSRRCAAPPRPIVRARVVAQEYTSGFAALAPLRSARFGRLWRCWRWFAGFFLFLS